MPEALELALRPSAPNSLAWSVDGELAIAAKANIQLLIPRIGAKSDEEEWDRTHFEVGSFAPHEWVQREIPGGTIQDFFIAREPRESEVMAMQWSPPGLASHDKCVLGVLTSNGFLSVLSPGAKLLSGAGWFRTTIINYATPGQPDERLVQVDGEVRAFAWLPEALSARPHFRLVVMTDTSVYIIRISNKADNVTREIEKRLTIPPEAPTSSLREEADRYQYGCHLTWSVPDSDDEDVSSKESRRVRVAYLVVAFRGWIRQLIVSQDVNHLEMQPSLNWSNGCLSGHGPIALSSNRLYYVYQDTICSISYSPDDFKTLARQSRASSAQDGWDPPTAMTAFCGGVILQQYLSLASYAEHGEDNQDLSYFRHRSGSRLQDELAKKRAEYAEDNSLGHRTTVQMHGIATFTDPITKTRWIACIVTFGPSEQLQYKLSASERATVLFTHEDYESGERLMPDEELKFPWAEEPTLVGADIVLTQVLDLIPTLKLQPSNISKRIALLQVFAHLILQSPMKRVKAALTLLGSFDGPAWARAHASVINDRMVSADTGLETVHTLIRSTAEDEQFSNLLEYCSIPGCGHFMMFSEGAQALEEAVCAGGHRFDRCSLTLLAIIQPFMSKECQRCSRTCYDEDKVGEEWESVKKIVGHTRRCQYCESKFFG